jgi:hypothetical protein
MKFYITGIKRGLGKYLHDRLNVVESFEECDVFINCKHDGFNQVEMLYEAYDWGVRAINISSNSGDGIKKYAHSYAIEKAALDKANEQLFYLGMETTCLRFGWIDTERVADIEENKMSLKSVLDTIEWVLLHPHRVKEITITPDEDTDNEQLRISDRLYDYQNMYATQHKQLPHTYNLEKIKEEIKDLPDLHDNQIMLQSLDGKDFYTGLLQIDKMPEGVSETDFFKLNVPLDSEIAKFIRDTGITRARLMVMPPKSCYTFHFDPTPRIHLVIQTNEWSFMTDNKWRLFHVPDDGHPYYFDTTKPHTAINSALEERIHIVGIAPLKPYK